METMSETRPCVPTAPSFTATEVVLVDVVGALRSKSAHHTTTLATQVSGDFMTRTPTMVTVRHVLANEA